MKTTRMMAAVILIAFTALFANFARGQEPVTLVNGLPNRLPIGNHRDYLEWIVTNSVAGVGAGITYTNTRNEVVELIPWINEVELHSYSDFRSWVDRAGNLIIDSLRKATGRDQISPQSQIRFYASLQHRFPDSTKYGYGAEVMSIYSLIGKLSEVDSNTFSQLPLNRYYTMIGIPGLNKIEINVPNKHYVLWSNGVAKYTYNGLANQADGFIPPKEYLIPNLVALAPWYSTNRYPGVRITLGTTNGVERTYTGLGYRLNVDLQMSRSNLIVRGARGSEAVIEWSEDLLYWQSYTNVAVPEITGRIDIPIDRSLPCRFFRAFSR